MFGAERTTMDEAPAQLDIADDIARFAEMGLLGRLLKDRSTGRNIIWASNVFVDKGESYAPSDEILLADITGDNAGLIRTRASKAKEAQSALTRAHAEVFTPTWIVEKMVDAADGAWWEAHPDATWQDYVRSPRLEITCGEAPYLTSRYDAADGTPIPVDERVGILDRKLKFVGEHTTAQKTWAKFAHMALQSTYGYEFQGDNLLIARVNVLATLEDYSHAAGHVISRTMYERFARTISWNLWQMDGLSDMPPLFVPEVVPEEEEIPKDEMLPGFAELFGDDFEEDVQQPAETQLRLDGARIYDWIEKQELWFSTLGGEGVPMKFDYVIGNPPYQGEATGDSNTATPIYNRFMDSAYEMTEKAMLITPARFLFNAGYTPKPWNRKMLNDPHFKVVYFNPNSSEVFSGVDIKGGVAITYRDTSQNFGAIETFTRFPMLNRVLHTVANTQNHGSLSDIIVTSFAYHFTELMYSENPSLRGRASKGHAYDLQSNSFDKFPEVFLEERPSDGDYVRVLGRAQNTRCWRYIRRSYINDVINLGKYKAFYPKAVGTGSFGETLPDPILGMPNDGATVTFISIGSFDTEREAQNCITYMKSKFARAMLGVLKVTQDMTPGKFKHVPLQDFTSASDIDWSQTVANIDQQLYAKYGLSQEEIDFIESHVKEMQ